VPAACSNSKILDVPVGFFYEGYDQAPAGEGVAYGAAENGTSDFEYEKLSSRETLEMMRAYYRISDPQVRKRVFELMKSLADQPENEPA
jgi:hypothetical protein